MTPVAETWRRVWGDLKCFRGPKFLNDGFFKKKFPLLSLFRFSLPVLCKMSYMTISSQENHYFTKNSFTPFFKLCSCFLAHPTTLLLKILGGAMHGPSYPHQIFSPSPP